jgi:hypothetical protein
MRWWLLVLFASAASCKKPVQFDAPRDTADAAPQASAAATTALEAGATVAADVAPASSAPMIGTDGLPVGLPATCRILEDTPPAGMMQAVAGSEGRVHLSGVQGDTDCKPIDATHMACDAWVPRPGVRGRSKPWTMAMRVEPVAGRVFYGHSVLGGPLYCYEREPRLAQGSANIGPADCATCKPGTSTTKKDTGPKKTRR